MTKMSWEADIEELLGRNRRQVDRYCRRKFGTLQPTKAQLLEALRSILLGHVNQCARHIARLGEQTAEAARQIEILDGVMRAQTSITVTINKKAKRRDR